MQQAIKRLNNYNAPGCEYGICAEALKYGGLDLQVKLTKVCNMVKNGLVAPRQWTHNLVIPIPKKGDLSQTVQTVQQLYNNCTTSATNPKSCCREVLGANFNPGHKLLGHLHFSTLKPTISTTSLTF